MRDRSARLPHLKTDTDGTPHADNRPVAIRIERESVPARVPSGSTDEQNGDRTPVRTRDRPRIGSAARFAFGIIWLIDAYFKWQPSFLHGLLDVVKGGAEGQPGWLMPWFNLVHAIVAVQPTLWAYAIAVVETGIALALILGVARKVVYVGGALWSLLIWSTAEGFGRTSSGEIATDVGTAIAYAVVFMALLAVDECGGTGSLSLDAAIERRVPWWSRVAEVRR